MASTSCGYLIVYNPSSPALRAASGFSGNGSDPRIPPNGTVVAVPALVNGVLQELSAPGSIATTDVTELEIPINEIDFLRPGTDTAGVPGPLRPYIGRLAAEALGKALFWDMQVGSDGVQS